MTDQTHSTRVAHRTVTPYLTVKGAKRAIDFYQAAFSATELYRITDNDGRLGHAELQIGDCVVMLSDEYPEINVVSPETLGNSPVALSLEVDDAEVWANRAVTAGAKLLRPVEDKGDGTKRGVIECPFGHRWFLVTTLD